MIEMGAPKTISQIRIKKKWMNLIAKYKVSTYVWTSIDTV